MSNPQKQENRRFEEKWGGSTLKGGFTQMPNEFIRGLKELGITPHEALVAEYILSVGKGFAAAKSIAEAQNISVSTVRKCFRRLEKLGYIRRIREVGEANRFDVNGLIESVSKLSLARQRSRHMRDKGISNSNSSPIHKSSSNKDVKIHKDYKDEPGYKSFLKQKQRLKGKRNGL